MSVWLCVCQHQCCTPRVRLVPGEGRLSRLTPGPLFPGPGSVGGGQCSGPVLPAWELSVGAWGPWSATKVSIASRLSTNGYGRLVFKLNTLHAFCSKANIKLSTSLFVLLLGRRVPPCMCLQHADCLDKIQPSVYLLGNPVPFCLD